MHYPRHFTFEPGVALGVCLGRFAALHLSLVVFAALLFRQHSRL